MSSRTAKRVLLGAVVNRNLLPTPDHRMPKSGGSSFEVAIEPWPELDIDPPEGPVENSEGGAW